MVRSQPHRTEDTVLLLGLFSQQPPFRRGGSGYRPCSLLFLILSSQGTAALSLQGEQRLGSEISILISAVLHNADYSTPFQQQWSKCLPKNWIEVNKLSWHQQPIRKVCQLIFQAGVTKQSQDQVASSRNEGAVSCLQRHRSEGQTSLCPCVSKKTHQKTSQTCITDIVTSLQFTDFTKQHIWNCISGICLGLTQLSISMA